MTTQAIVPHTRIDNSIIDSLPAQLGIYALGIYVAIKRYLDTRTGDCYPSYQTIAKKLRIDRSTAIRYVKKMKELKIISPEWRFKEDGSHTSNQYNFQGRENSGSSNIQAPGFPGASKNVAETVQIDQGTENSVPSGGGSKQSPVSGSEPPEQEKKKKERTMTDVDFYPTEKQKACPHPPTEIVFLAENVTICNHCYGLLDENLKLHTEDKPVENVRAA